MRAAYAIHWIGENTPDRPEPWDIEADKALGQIAELAKKELFGTDDYRNVKVELLPPNQFKVTAEWADEGDPFEVTCSISIERHWGHLSVMAGDCSIQITVEDKDAIYEALGLAESE